MRKNTIRHPEIGGIVHLEHINFVIADYDHAAAFFMAGLGLTRDPYTRADETNMAVNVGQQQFHLPRRAGTPPMHGVVGLLLPDLDDVKARFDGLAAEGIFDGTPYAYAVKDDCHEVMSPFGVRLRLHPTGSLTFPRVLGLPYVEIPVPPGTAEGVGRFYERVMRAPVSVKGRKGRKVAAVTMGPYQWTRFIETPGLDDYDNGSFHIAYYVTNYGEVFDWIDGRRVPIGAGEDQVFFFRDIVDPESGEQIFALENEIRSFYHTDFMRPLVNRWPMSDERHSFQRDPDREERRKWVFMPGI